MNTQWRHTVLALTFVFALAAPAFGASDTITYQGVLVDSAGAPVADGNYDIRFRIFAAPAGGTALWSENHPSIPAAGGVFSVELGIGTPFNNLFANNALLFLDIRANLGDGLQTYVPRVVLTAAPYALSARNAETVEDVSLDGVLDLVADSYSGAGVASTISGGNSNAASGFRSTVGGGGGNSATNEDATVSGGVNNEAQGENSTIGGGGSNDAIGNGSTVGGGIFNIASGANSTVGGGALNQATGSSSTIPGGEDNRATGKSSFAAGDRCEANGDYSTAMGRGAVVNGDGSFLWRDSTVFAGLALAFDNVFAAQASNGVLFLTSTDGLTGAILGGGSGTWTNLSDRNRKKDFEPIDSADVLEKVAGMPITEWSYITEGGVRHLGPTSQDFYEAFGLGIDDKGIATLDGSGVALAAIQGLVKRLDERDAQLQAMQARIDSLTQLVEAVVTRTGSNALPEDFDRQRAGN